MIPNLVVTHQGSRAALSLLAGGVLLVVFSGPITAAALAAVKAPAADCFRGRLASFVVDYRRSVIAVRGSELDAVLAGDSPESDALLPAALIVRPAVADIFMGHALRMARFGVMRRVFYDLPAGTAWALERAGRDHRSARQSPQAA